MVLNRLPSLSLPITGRPLCKVTRIADRYYGYRYGKGGGGERG